MALTPSDVWEVSFKDAHGGRPGYDKHEVDVFLHRVAATLDGRDTLTAEDVLGFTPSKRYDGGYAVYAVDAFFAEIALTLMERNKPVPATGHGHRPAVPVSHPAPVAHPAPPAPPRQPPHGNAVPRPRPPASPPPNPMNGHAVRAQPPAPPQHPQPRGPQAPNDISPAQTGQGQVYSADEVHAFLARIQETVAGRDTITAQDVLAARFNPPPPGRRGYGETEFLYLVAETLKGVEGAAGSESTRGEVARAVQAVTPTVPPLSAQEIRDVRFHQTPPDEFGYSEDEVDAFLDRIEATLEGADVLTSHDVREVRFGEVPGGYDQNEVDTLLDLIEQRLDG